VIGTILAQYSSSNDDPLTIPTLRTSDHGAVTTKGTTATYTPATNFHGTDSFTYTAKDAAGNSATATVTITVVDNSTVTAVNDSATRNENTANTVNVLANDDASVGDPLTV